MHAFLQKAVRVVVGFSLHILRQRQGNGARIGRIGQYAHGIERSAHQLLGTVDTVPVFAHRLERIVGADAQVVKLLDLLQHRIGLATGIDITRQQQQRNAVGRGRCSGGDHVRRAWTDRRAARVDFATQVLFGKTDSGMAHALLVTSLMDHQVAAVLLQRLPNPKHVAMPENGEDASDEFALYAIDFDVLVIEKLHQGLGHGQSGCTHVRTLFLFEVARV